jgi:hypothetical protein
MKLRLRRWSEMPRRAKINLSIAWVCIALVIVLEWFRHH